MLQLVVILCGSYLIKQSFKRQFIPDQNITVDEILIGIQIGAFLLNLVLKKVFIIDILYKILVWVINKNQTVCLLTMSCHEEEKLIRSKSGLLKPIIINKIGNMRILCKQLVDLPCILQ